MKLTRCSVGHFFDRDKYKKCPNCISLDWNVLPLGSILKNQYKIIDVANYRVYPYVIYEALDIKNQTIVEIQELYDKSFARRESISKCVIATNEFFEKQREQAVCIAKRLMRCAGCKELVNMYEYFEENNTVYRVVKPRNLTKYISLSDLYKEYKLSIADIIAIVRRVLLAVGHIHSKGMLHLNLSPREIKVLYRKVYDSQKDEEIINITDVKLKSMGCVEYLPDFNLITSIPVMNYAYAAPECYTEKGKKIGSEADIYSVGVLLYWLTTGNSPVEAMGRMPKDSLIEPVKINPDISCELNEIILKAMAVKPMKRFRSTKEFLKKLEDIDSHIKVEEYLKSYIGFQTEMTGVFGYAFFDEQLEMICRMGSVIAPDIVDMHISGLGIEWSSCWRTDVTINLIQQRDIRDKYDTSIAHLVHYFDEPEYYVFYCNDEKVKVYIEKEEYIFLEEDKVVATIERFYNEKIFPKDSENLRIKDGIRVKMYRNVSKEMTLLILSFVALKF